MIQSKIITQDEFLERARRGELIIKVFPIKFANGYFVTGVCNSILTYATVREEKTPELQRLINIPEINSGENK